MGPAWLNPFHSQYDTFLTSRTREDVASLLGDRAAMHGYRNLFWVCSKPLAGWAAADGFVLSRCVPYRNTYRTFAQGKLLTTEEGTLISCRTRIHHLTLVGALVIVVLWILLLSFLPVPVLWLIFALWLSSVILRLYLARDDRRFLLATLRTTVDARPQPPSVVDPDTGRQADARQVFRRLPGHHVPLWSWLLSGALAILLLGRLVLALAVMLKYG
jgi:hypothetical protein